MNRIQYNIEIDISEFEAPAGGIGVELFPTGTVTTMLPQINWGAAREYFLLLDVQGAGYVSGGLPPTETPLEIKTIQLAGLSVDQVMTIPVPTSSRNCVPSSSANIFRSGRTDEKQFAGLLCQTGIRVVKLAVGTAGSLAVDGEIQNGKFFLSFFGFTGTKEDLVGLL